MTGLPLSFRDASYRQRQRLVLAVELSGDVTGYCDYVLPEVGSTDEKSATRGAVRFLWYDAGHRTAGEALLDAAESALRDAGATRVTAFKPGIMPFHKNLSDQLVHVRALFTARNYKHLGGELYLKWSNFAEEAMDRLRRDAQLPADVTVSVEEYYENRDGKGQETPRPSTRVYAIAASGEKLGICETISSNEYDDSSELADTCFVSWLGVPPDKANLQPIGYNDRSNPVQGRGLGVSQFFALSIARRWFPSMLEAFKSECAAHFLVVVLPRCLVSAEGSAGTLVARNARTGLHACEYLH